MRKKLPKYDGWTIVDQCHWFAASDRPDYVVTRNMNNGMLDVVVAEVTCRHETPLTKNKINQLCRYAEHLPNQVAEYRLWMIVCDETEIPPDVREYGNDCSPCFSFIRLFH